MLRLVPVLWVIAEVAGFALAGQVLGVLGTLGLLALATLGGAMLLRQRGAATLRALSGSGVPGAPFGTGFGLGRDAARDPTRLLREGGFGLVAGMLLILPGFVSDLLALALLLPPVQRAVLRRLGLTGRTFAPSPHPSVRTGPVIVDAEWIDVSPSAPPPPRAAGPETPARGASGWTRPE